jgi:hypothetical protein
MNDPAPPGPEDAPPPPDLRVPSWAPLSITVVAAIGLLAVAVWLFQVAGAIWVGVGQAGYVSREAYGHWPDREDVARANRAAWRFEYAAEAITAVALGGVAVMVVREVRVRRRARRMHVLPPTR